MKQEKPKITTIVREVTMKEIYKDDSIEHPEQCPDCGYDIIDCSCEE